MVRNPNPEAAGLISRIYPVTSGPGRDQCRARLLTMALDNRGGSGVCGTMPPVENATLLLQAL